ncbi:VOC family protein [Candidatus Spongiihabitans sp.]|uniref:VOC family protein n=1 Tax=Candidatus Spongiihabitans sp. TaxID=3101308 RepID=UPI003C7D62B9
MTNFESLSGEQVGHLLDDFGVNLLVSKVHNTVKFLTTVFDFTALRSSTDYALLKHRDRLYQLHGDQTYAAHPLAALLPEAGVRGVGVELRLYQVDPDRAERRARQGGYEILQSTADKPHGLRECFVLDPDGYCWVPSIKIARGKIQSSKI